MSHNVNNISNCTNFQFSQTNSDSYQDITTTWADVSGSSIAYTPTSNSDFVIYEFTFLQSQHPDDSSDDHMVAYYKFLYSDDNGSSWSELSNSRHFIGAASGSNLRIRGMFTIKQCVAYWSNNQRLFKLQVKKPSNTYTSSLHINAGFYDNTATMYTDRYIRPIVSCISVTNL